MKFDEIKKRRKQKWELGEYVTHFPYTHKHFIVAAKYTNLFVCLYISRGLRRASDKIENEIQN